jgi:hypothetical protein
MAILAGPEIRVPARAKDTESATLRYLLFGLLPTWFVPGLLDWLQHRRTDIEHTSGTRQVALPYGEELYRCVRAASSRRAPQVRPALGE